ncbi:glycosyltransferase family A protein [Chamaesiphon sp. OTE_20_metabat_361]|uniref:glycosyltransferase family A protein n=1 Tax=Chamaesiphon sp. OTE_20_metabat_361 TaxID=2964689 RepID=UPI00286AFA03|nr:glycosyltransferase family A protein [Chamaesiphon sp. OTE_20_metabat_361]
MFVFIVPLRSPETCNDWAKVSALCNGTLHSLLDQSSPNYHIILVCNVPPIDFVPHPRISVIQESFPVPNSLTDRFGDIYLKIKRGMLAIKQLQLVQKHSDTFVMRVDADDLVSNRLVAFTEKHPYADGWFFASGYIHEVGSNHLFLHPQFMSVSGTSHIIRCNYADFPDSMDVPATEWLDPIWQHLNVNSLLESRGKKLRSLPFAGAVYQINFQNVSATHLNNIRFSSMKAAIWKALFKRKITSIIIKEFGFCQSTIEGVLSLDEASPHPWAID